jgi:hypothetical protein
LDLATVKLTNERGFQFLRLLKKLSNLWSLFSLVFAESLDNLFSQEVKVLRVGAKVVDDVRG